MGNTAQRTQTSPPRLLESGKLSRTSRSQMSRHDARTHAIATTCRDTHYSLAHCTQVFTSTTNTCVANIKVVVDASTTLDVCDVIEYDDAGLVVSLNAYKV